jgi:hypothetical protein
MDLEELVEFGDELGLDMEGLTEKSYAIQRILAQSEDVS